MLAKRIIPCLDVKDGRVVKGVRFVGLRDAGDPVEAARRYDAEGADEITFLDITASHEKRGIILDVVARTAEVLFTPLTVGGGVKSEQDIEALLDAGADKVAINTAAVNDPDLRAARRGPLGCAGDRRGDRRAPDRGSSRVAWTVVTHGGRRDTGRDAVAWAEEIARAGAGELLVTSMDRDGTRDGYDLLLTAAIARAVPVPVIASGGVGTLDHLRAGLVEGGADAALAASIFHDAEYTIGEAKAYLEAAGVPVRPARAGGPRRRGEAGALMSACVTLEEVVAAAHARGASLVPETSGYLALAVSDATSRLPLRLDDRAVLLTTEGTVTVRTRGEAVAPAEAARLLRDLLARLLAASAGSMPNLTATARPRPAHEQDPEAVARELEAALIPVNRNAARRALARLARETLRAKEAGRLRRPRTEALAKPAAPEAEEMQPPPQAEQARRDATAAAPRDATAAAPLTHPIVELTLSPGPIAPAIVELTLSPGWSRARPPGQQPRRLRPQAMVPRRRQSSRVPTSHRRLRTPASTPRGPSAHRTPASTSRRRRSRPQPSCRRWWSSMSPQRRPRSRSFRSSSSQLGRSRPWRRSRARPWRSRLKERGPCQRHRSSPAVPPLAAKRSRAPRGSRCSSSTSPLALPPSRCLPGTDADRVDPRRVLPRACRRRPALAGADADRGHGRLGGEGGGRRGRALPRGGGARRRDRRPGAHRGRRARPRSISWRRTRRSRSRRPMAPGRSSVGRISPCLWVLERPSRRSRRRPQRGTRCPGPFRRIATTTLRLRRSRRL